MSNKKIVEALEEIKYILMFVWTGIDVGSDANNEIKGRISNLSKIIKELDKEE